MRVFCAPLERRRRGSVDREATSKSRREGNGGLQVCTCGGQQFGGKRPLRRRAATTTGATSSNTTKKSNRAGRRRKEWGTIGTVPNDVGCARPPREDEYDSAVEPMISSPSEIHNGVPLGWEAMMAARSRRPAGGRGGPQAAFVAELGRFVEQAGRATGGGCLLSLCGTSAVGFSLHYIVFDAFETLVMFAAVLTLAVIRGKNSAS